jgi:hypothetical protein
MIEVEMLHTLRRSHRNVPCALLALSLAPSAAWAQPAPAQPAANPAQPAAAVQPVDEGRQHFELGVAAMQRQDWTTAFNEFEASSRLRRSASVALNLGVVLREQRRFIEARVRLAEFSELANAEQHRQHDARVQEMLSEISRRLGRLRVVEMTPPTATITLDARRVQLNDAGETVVDPGAHAVHVEAQGFLAHDESIEVAESATRDLRFNLVAAPVETPHPAQPAVIDPRVAQTPVTPAQVSRPVYTRWWFWTAVGVGAIAVGATAFALSNRVRDLPAANDSISALQLAGAP